MLLQQFVNELHDDSHVETWQVEQADRAVRLYFHNFRSGDGIADAKASRVTIEPDGHVVSGDLISAVRQSLRIQHYSYRTEQTYLDWIKRFLLYLGRSAVDSEQVIKSGRRRAGRPRDKDIAESVPEKVLITEQGIKDYLAWLALRRDVSARTQNQAFNALLFMARSALKLELGELEKGIRARGRFGVIM